MQQKGNWTLCISSVQRINLRGAETAADGGLLSSHNAFQGQVKCTSGINVNQTFTGMALLIMVELYLTLC